MVLFILVILFSIQNKEEVILRFGLYPIQDYQWQVPQVPLFLVILCSICLGILIGGMGDVYRYIQLKKTIHQNQKMIERLESEIRSLGGPRRETPSFLKEDI